MIIIIIIIIGGLAQFPSINRRIESQKHVVAHEN